ncbi:VOC family protein [Nodosilinea sp. PGN35]|uniref:VOC family protein n=1 Tax=Nodosilinea sp. PGN35 TaxID=3020489 RepID=UPI0023B2F51B|nr:VOC family protein [Nodosilinea sp. TSF1-S3]MDF0365101.1 VOC family protein [Nodosilinea sp. TSF1-S3]
MANTVTPFLMFEGSAEKAMTLYTSVFSGCQVGEIEFYGAGELGPEGSVKQATLTVGGLTIMCTDSPISHDFSFTPAMSLFVDCTSAAELERAFEQLSAGGEVLMPLDDYGFSQRFGWVNDRFGVSWQLNLAK